MKNGRLHLLIVEDEAAHMEAIRRAFDQTGAKADIHAAGTLREYRDIIAAHPPDFALVDLNLPDGRATEILTHPAAEAPFPILVMTAFGNQQIVVEVMKAGALDYVVKSPETFAAMPQTVARALREWQLLQKQKRAEADLKASEERYRGLVETTFDWVWEVDAQGRYTYASPRVLDLLGYRPEEMIGRTPFDLMPEDEARRVQAVFAQIAAQREPFALLENTNRHRDGRLVVLETNGTPILSPEGTLLGYRGMDRDITERKRAEEALRESENNLRLAEQIAHLGYWSRDIATGELSGSNETYRIFGVDQNAGKINQRAWINLFHPEDRQRVSRAIQDAEAGIRPYDLEYRALRPDGTARWIYSKGEVRLDKAGHPERAFGIVLDITERKRAEADLKVSEDRYRRLFDESLDGICLADAQTGMILDCNPALSKLVGREKHELVGQSQRILHPPGEAVGEVSRSFKQHRHEKSGQVLAVPVITKTGEVRTAEIIANMREVQGRQLMVGIFRDVTERVRAEASHARLVMAVEHTAETIVITDHDGAILYANPAFEKTSGYTRAEALGQNPRLLKSGKHDAEFYRRMWAVLAAGQVWSGDMINKRKDGTFYEEDVNISPVRDAAGKIVNYVAVKRDITEQKKLEAQLRRTQRLESIGTLAGGIAHDLNNALAPIMMSAELLRLEFPDTASRYLELIQASTKRGADMVKQLLTFAKGIEGERLLLQPKHLLKEMEKLIQNTFLKEIELRTHYPKDLWTILGDATQLHQVLLNLCVNARDAMPGGGTLTLEAENQELDAAYASTVPEAKPGRYVVWRVKDTGTGIPPEVLERIFDPFFTTKGPDKGTGIGLSTTLGIVKSHGGFIRVYSTPGQGSTFAVYLPAYGAGASDTVLLTKADTAFCGHGETILVVDDEPAVRNMLRAVLTRFNFKVLTAGDGADALLQVAEHQTELRAVITDLHMPNMDGLSFVRVLKGRLPGAGIIVASGRMEEREENEFKQLGVHAVLQKPCTQEQLVEALKTVFQK